MTTYKYTSDMIKAATKAGYIHIGGKGFECKACKEAKRAGSKQNMRKFRKDGRTIMKCKCGHHSS
jgi:hypothetical protein